MTTPAPKCQTCKHLFDHWRVGGLCWHPLTEGLRMRRSNLFERLHSIDVFRSIHGACGPSGKLYEPKESK